MVGVNIAISNNVGGVKHISSTLPDALMKERHFALVEGLRVQPGLALNRQGQELSPTQPSLRSHHSVQILAEGLVTPPQLAQRPQSVFPVVDRPQHSRAQQVG